jgi:hypothetical protein
MNELIRNQESHLNQEPQSIHTSLGVVPDLVIPASSHRPIESKEEITGLSLIDVKMCLSLIHFGQNGISMNDRTTQLPRFGTHKGMIVTSLC